jgi:hypothetical protein
MPVRAARDREGASPPLPTAVSTAIRNRAATSSMIRIPITSSRTRRSTSRCWKVCATIIVLEMHTMAPPMSRVTPSPPNSPTTSAPRKNDKPISTSATSPARGATRLRRRKLNSRPMENIRKMTPSSPSSRMRSRSANSGTPVSGPTITPASR